MRDLYLRCELEAYILEVVLRECQGVACVSEEYVATMLVYCHVGMLAALEVGELCLILRLYPARLMYRYRLPATLRTILVLETILYNLEL